MKAEKFWSLFDTSDTNGCWLWPRALNTSGYGVLKIGGRKGILERAHRHAFRLGKGEIPEGKFVCHTCDIRRCCNPKHLWIGSLQDNHRDMMAKGRNRSVAAIHLSGEKHPLHKLTNSQRKSLREWRKKGWSYRKLAKKYGISSPTAHQICNGKDYSYRKGS